MTSPTLTDAVLGLTLTIAVLTVYLVWTERRIMDALARIEAALSVSNTEIARIEALVANQGGLTAAQADQVATSVEALSVRLQSVGGPQPA